MWKNILILFSGGLDSTYLLDKNLKEGNHVVLVYTTIKNNSNKIKSELHAIGQIVEFYKNRYPNKIDNVIYNEVDVFGHCDGILFKQLPIHIFSLLTMVDSLQSEVQIGYCMNDDMVSYLPDLKNLYDSYRPFLKDGAPDITFPVAKMQKENMFDSLPIEVQKLVFSCEDPIGLCEPCGKCHPCLRYEYQTKLGFERWKGTRLIKSEINTGILEFEPGSTPEDQTISVKDGVVVSNNKFPGIVCDITI
jgi:hypothetical protein